VRIKAAENTATAPSAVAWRGPPLPSPGAHPLLQPEPFRPLQWHEDEFYLRRRRAKEAPPRPPLRRAAGAASASREAQPRGGSEAVLVVRWGRAGAGLTRRGRGCEAVLVVRWGRAGAGLTRRGRGCRSLKRTTTRTETSEAPRPPARAPGLRRARARTRWRACGRIKSGTDRRAYALRACSAARPPRCSARAARRSVRAPRAALSRARRA
jgi:hypothetical protein